MQRGLPRPIEPSLCGFVTESLAIDAIQKVEDKLGGVAFSEDLEIKHNEPEQAKEDQPHTTTIKKRKGLARPETIADAPRSYADIAAKPFLVKTIQWNTTQSRDSLLPGSDLILPLEAAINCQQRQGFVNMRYWRGDVELRIFVNSTAFHQGQLLCWWAPNVPRSVAVARIPGNNRWRASCMQHALITASEPNEVRMIIKYAHPEHVIDTNIALDNSIRGNLGTFGIMVLSPLQAGTGSTNTVDVTIHASFPNSEFYLPRPVNTCTSLVRGFIPEGNTVHKETTYVNVWENVNADNMTQAEGGDEFDQTGPSTDISMQNGGADLDKPGFCGEPVEVRPCTVGDLNMSRTLYTGGKMSLYGKDQPIVKKDHFNREEDEMRIINLMKKEQYGGYHNWTTTDTAGTQLFHGYIVPSFHTTNHRVNPSPNPTTNNVPMVYGDYLSNMFLYWYGNIKLKIRIVASNMVSGKLLLSAHYGEYSDVMLYEEATTQYYTTISLSGGKKVTEVEFVCPIKSTYLRTTNFQKDQLRSTTAQISLYTPGSFYVHVQNPLVVGSGAPATVEIQYWYSSDDISFFQLKPCTMTPEPVPEQMTITLPEDNTLKEETFITESKEENNDVVVLGRKSENIDFVRNDNLVHFVSLRELLKKFWDVGYVTARPLIFNEENIFDNGMFDVLSSLYAGRRGNMRYKVVFGGDSASETFTAASLISLANGICKAYFIPFSEGAYTGLAFPAESSPLDGCRYELITERNEQFLTWEVPFISQYKYLINEEVVPSILEEWYHITGNNYVQTAFENNKIQLYAAGGDELRFALLVGPPRVTLSETLI